MEADRESVVSIETAADHPREVRTRDELRSLLAAHDLSGLHWTNRVLVERGAVPHSHPVLTLNTRTTADALLSTYLHEQLHWWLDACPYLSSAVEATRTVWPTVSDRSGGGAKSETSTREHLLLCHLQQRALTALVGDPRAQRTLQQHIDDAVYPWIFTQVCARRSELDAICSSHQLWPARLSRT